MTIDGALENLFGLKGKVALVTGASAGLGIEFAKALSTAGADVAILARRKDRLDNLTREIEQAGARCLPVQADLVDWAQIERAVSTVEDELGKVDILVNNAGMAPLARAENFPRDLWDSTIALNLTAVFLISQRVARGMIERGEGGRIINIISVTGQGANSIYPTVAYNASKGGLAAMTKQLAVEWARHDITVNGISPGWFPTEMSIDPRYGDIHPKYKEKMESLTPMGRLGREGELRGAVIYLASPASSFVTGAVLNVDGGWTAW